MNNEVRIYWEKHYQDSGYCQVCGNWGKINTVGLKAPNGKECGKINYCFCPNGQMLRLKQEKED